MLNIQSIPIEWWLIGARAAGLLLGFIALTWALVRWRRGAQADTQRVFEQIDIALTELRTLADVNNALSARVDALAQRMDSTARSAPPPSAPSMRGYEIATRMARSGASVEELVKSCGLTRHEAELVARLHGSAVPQPAKEPAREFQPAQPAASARPRDSEPAERLTNPNDFAALMSGAPMPAAASRPRSRLSVVG